MCWQCQLAYDSTMVCVMWYQMVQNATAAAPQQPACRAYITAVLELRHCKAARQPKAADVIKVSAPAKHHHSTLKPCYSIDVLLLKLPLCSEEQTGKQLHKTLP